MIRKSIDSPQTERPLPWRSGWGITLAYMAVGVAWIVTTDFAAFGSFDGSPGSLISLTKGIFWIVSSALLLHILVFRRVERSRRFEEAVRRRLLEGEELGKFGIAELIEGESEVRWSLGMFRLWGRRVEEGEPGRDWLLRHIDPPDAERVREATDAAVRGEAVPPYDIRINQVDGTARVLRITTKSEREDGRSRSLIVAQDVTELRALERSASESVALLRAVLDSTAEGIVVARADTLEVLLWNDRFLEMSGVGGESPDRRDVEHVFVRNLAGVRTPQGGVDLDLAPGGERTDTIETPDGTILERRAARVVSSSASPLLIWSFRDVTERFRARVRLERSERQLALAQRIAGVGSFEFDMDQGELRWSETMFEIFDAARGARPSLETVVERVIPEDRPIIYAALDQARARQQTIGPLTARIARRDGEVRVLEIRGERIPGPTEAGTLIGTVRDYTPEHTAQAELREAARQINLLLSSTDAGLFTVDLEGRCTLINRAARESLGYSEDAIIGHPARQLVYGGAENVPPTADAAIARANEGRSTKLFHHRFVRRDGSPLICDITVSPIRDDGRVIGRAVSFVDIGERMRLEEQLEEAKRISGLGRLAASIAHEINNVLMGILPFAEIVARSAEPAHRTAAEQIRRSVQRGRGVTQEILRFARQEKPDRQLFEGGAWLRATAAELHQIAGPRLAVETPDQPFYLDADPAQLAQVLINLVMNANDAVDPSSGRITVAVAPRDEGSLFPFGALPERGHRWIWFRVIDDGAGMDGETLQHLLEPFFTKKRGGTGLGLPIAYRIVAAHGGLFFVESAEGQGSTFHIFLPEAPRPAAPLPPDPAPRAALSGEVLLVEDDETVAAGLALMLADAGMTCRVVGTGLEALHALELSLPAVVILDIGLPDIDGAQICEEAIRRHPRVPIVISTGHADASRLGTCLENPHVRFLRKPYEFEQLLEVMKEAIAGGR